MGNLFSRKSNQNLSTDPDINRDGSISRREFNDWKNGELQDIINSKITMNIEIDRLSKINKSLEKELLEKNETIQELLNDQSNPKIIDKTNKLSTLQIDNYISNIMKENNIPYLPDTVERQVYRNIFKLLLEVIGSTSCEFVGHKIAVNVMPSES
jgi:hypothetical protein